MEKGGRHLVILSCSSTKWSARGEIPAVIRYDGPLYRVLRSYLRESLWPTELSVGVISAKYGLIGGLSPIDYYDEKLDPQKAVALKEKVTTTLVEWSSGHSTVTLICGKDYLLAFDLDDPAVRRIEPEIIKDPIGVKLSRWRNLLQGMKKTPWVKPNVSHSDRLLYFLPDWDDMVDPGYDFHADTFSAARKSERKETHVTQLMGKVCDGILVSLAQRFGSKGALKKLALDDPKSLAPESLRKRFGLSENQWLFGDCGAFSYVKEEVPVMTTEQAVALYELYDFDFGASVDHIPAPDLPEDERWWRLKLTRDRAADFIKVHKEKRCKFTPVGVIQGVTLESYADQLPDYVDMGYRYIAVGGLVFRSDKEILEIARLLSEVRKKLTQDIWIHLLGVFRPNIQPQLRRLGVRSFDSATYFRKAWLRSSQNYLGVDGKWYAAIRVPVSHDPRTRKGLHQNGIPLEQVKEFERQALDALHEYGQGRRSLDQTLEAVLRYDALLSRSEGSGADFASAYERTLAVRPWEKCGCPVCTKLGIDVVIFRGSNRNKRRGIHNTMLLYRKVCSLSQPEQDG